MKALCTLAALCSIVALTTAVRADQLDSGLSKRFALSLGYYNATTIDIFAPQVSSHGLAAKLDYSFYRPTRHEAVASLWYLKGKSGDDSESLVVASAEYRWRFGGHGAAYWSSGLGFGVSGGGIPDASNHNGNSFCMFFGLGMEASGVILESRALFGNGGSTILFLVGTRF